MGGTLARCPLPLPLPLGWCVLDLSTSLRKPLSTFRCRRARSRHWQSQHGHQRGDRAGVGRAGVRSHGGRPRVHGDLGRAQQPRLRNAVPDGVPVRRRLAVLAALGERVQRIPTDR